MQPIDLVLALPFPLNKAAIQQTAEIVRDTALFHLQLTHDLAYVVRPFAQELYDRETALIPKRAKEFTIKAVLQRRSSYEIN